MTLTAFILIIVSALFHVGWNLIGKRVAQTLLFYIWAMAAGGLMFSPFLIFHDIQLMGLPSTFWWLLCCSGLFQGLYLIGLARAYRSGDMSMVYPLARALPVVVVPLVIVILYGSTAVTAVEGLGMLLILAGAIALPLSRWTNWRPRFYLQPVMFWVLLAAVGTAGYSIVDSRALQIMRDSGMSAFQAGSSFVVLQAVTTVSWMVLLLGLIPGERLRGLQQKGMAILAGFFIVGTYMLVLISMTLVTEVSYVVALRQISIPLGVIIGAIWLQEKMSLPRIQGTVVMIFGLLLASI